MDTVVQLTSERPVVIFSRSRCAISHSIKTLFWGLGVNPAVYELDEITQGPEIDQALSQIGRNPTVPAIFIGGKLVGGSREVMSHHLNGSLRPMLEKAGALWV